VHDTVPAPKHTFEELIGVRLNVCRAKENSRILQHIVAKLMEALQAHRGVAISVESFSDEQSDEIVGMCGE